MPILPLARETTLDRFIAVAEAGRTIALIVTKDPEAAMVYYFRDPLRAFETYERLGKLNAPPAIVYVSPEDGAHRPVAQLHSASALALRAISWLARLVSRAADPEVHAADSRVERASPPSASDFSRDFASTGLSTGAGNGIRSAVDPGIDEVRDASAWATRGRCRGAPGRARRRDRVNGFRAPDGSC